MLSTVDWKSPKLRCNFGDAFAIKHGNYNLHRKKMLLFKFGYFQIVAAAPVALFCRLGVQTLLFLFTSTSERLNGDLLFL